MSISTSFVGTHNGMGRGRNNMISGDKGIRNPHAMPPVRSQPNNILVKIAYLFSSRSLYSPVACSPICISYLSKITLVELTKAIFLWLKQDEEVDKEDLDIEGEIEDASPDSDDCHIIPNNQVATAFVLASVRDDERLVWTSKTFLSFFPSLESGEWIWSYYRGYILVSSAVSICVLQYISC